MKVKELIEELKRCSPDAEVWVECADVGDEVYEAKVERVDTVPMVVIRIQ